MVESYYNALDTHRIRKEELNEVKTPTVKYLCMKICKV